MPPSAKSTIPQGLESVPWWRSFVYRLVGLYTLLTAVLLLGGIFWLHRLQKKEVVEKFGLALESVAATAAPFISGRDVQAIKGEGDTGKPEFQRLRTMLERLRSENHLREEQVYILREAPRGSGKFWFVVMLQKRSFVGTMYQPPPKVASLYRWVYDRGDAVSTPLYTDSNGTYISGLAPIEDEAGHTVALLQVDYGIDAYLAEIDRYWRIYVGGGAVQLLVSLLFGIGMRWYTGRKITALLRGTGAIHGEDYDHQVELPGRDELSAVAQALNQVLRKLKERFEMLKFLPRHTARMIEKAAREGGVHLSAGRLVEVAVLESDIRGFTRISGSLLPGEIIKMLNTYIRAQAELVEAAGGSIDKFMGDAVLAVFEGPDKERRAFHCAQQIQGEVRRMNRAGAFVVPINIGVGISVGEVVMGNMGSEHRMEHTVIGSTVNLAARLCSTAGPGEIVVAAALYERIASHPAGDMPTLPECPPERVPVKGFAEPATCYRIPAA